MATSYSITVDNTSPLIQYFASPKASSSGWVEAESGHTVDAAVAQYFQTSFHATNQDGDYATLLFNGTDVVVYGAKRDNHGAYTVTLDGAISNFNGNGPNVFQQELFRASGLSPSKVHNLTLMNSPSMNSAPLIAANNFFDVDFVVISTALSAGTTLYTNTWDDTNTTIQYAGAWRTAVDVNDYNNTVHTATSAGSTVTIPFSGTSIAVYGALNIDHGLFSVNLDGVRDPINYTGVSQALVYGGLVYSASGLKQTDHQLVITNLGSGAAAPFLDVDKVVVNGTVGGPSTSSTTATTTSKQSQSLVGSHPTSTTSGRLGNGTTVSASVRVSGGLLGGIIAAVATILVLACIGCCCCFARRRRRRRQDEALRNVEYEATPTSGGSLIEHGSDISMREVSAGGVLSGSEIVPYPSTPSASTNTTTQQLVHTPPVSDAASNPSQFITAIPGPPPSDNTSYLNGPNARESSMFATLTNPYGEPIEQGQAGASGAQGSAGSSRERLAEKSGRAPGLGLVRRDTEATAPPEYSPDDGNVPPLPRPGFV